MTKGRIFALILAFLILINVVGVMADFNYEENYNTYSRQYDTWVYDVDIDDEDTRIIVRHVWSSPSYGYNYDTESDRDWEYGPTNAEDRRVPLGLNSPSVPSYDIGRELINSFTRNNYYSSHYGYRRNNWGWGGGYYSNYW